MAGTTAFKMMHNLRLLPAVVFRKCEAGSAINYAEIPGIGEGMGEVKGERGTEAD